ncbi:MAG: 3-deoxy-7-phosphoheptulonate synthase [Candidatus Hydrogenedentes bacterium]|nr:3-deoxy-7-phosphoheptulonate synthase [Candidatus Hydrogenedentota bacterium]
MWQTDDLNVIATHALVTPRVLKQTLPVTQTASETVFNGRAAIRDILDKKDPRMLIVTGPCSIHDTAAALEYGERLQSVRERFQDTLYLVMRAYFEKPRTTVGWKGLINDPALDGSNDLNAGLRKAREILLALAEMGIPTATEMLEPIVPQYIADTVSWGSIGARTIESQTHREMASGLSMPVGFKNSTDGNLQIAINAMVSARGPHHFLGIDQDGQTCVVQTRGNPWCHLVLRGGGGMPNYDPVSIINAEELLQAAGLDSRIMIDCSHANCGRRPELQAHVLKDIIQQRVEHNTSLIGVMLESNLKPGSQRFPKAVDQLEYGVSITDPCIGWETTVDLLEYAHGRLKGVVNS